MVGINCLFNYDGINYRFNINSKSEKELINFEELRKTLRDHPKLKEVDFFDTEKYVVEIFDKGFDDYVKLPRDADICDYSKLRARLRPKSTLTLVNTVEESKKRPLASMYSEINMEEEHAAKVLRGSPPPARMRGSSPPSSSYRRSHSGISEIPRSEHLSRSHTSVKTPSLPSKPPTVQTPSFKPNVTPKPSPVPRKQPPPPPPPPVVKTPAPVKTPVVSKTPDTPRNPFSSSFSSSNSEISNTPRTSGFLDNGRSMDSYPPGVDQDSILLAKAVEKYNDEFINIMMFDEIWETDHVWPFVFREISGHGVKNIQNMKEARTAFKSLVDTYIEILQKTNLTETAANELWPMFGIFHANLNMKPFYGRIQILKDAFNKGIKDSGDKPPPPTSSTSPPLLPTTSTTTTTQQPSLSQTTTASLSASQQPQQQQEEAPKPQRIQTKEPPEDFIRLCCDETDQSDVRMEEDDDDIQEVHPNTSPPPPPPPPQPPQKTSPPALSTSTSPPLPKPATESQPIVVTSDDFRLLLAVEDHNKEFYDDVVSEYSVWRDVTDQINLFQPFEPSLVTKYKTRFYELLKEFTRIESSSMPVSEKASWKLYSSFINIDIAPFLSKL